MMFPFLEIKHFVKRFYENNSVCMRCKRKDKWDCWISLFIEDLEEDARVATEFGSARMMTAGEELSMEGEKECSQISLFTEIYKWIQELIPEKEGIIRSQYEVGKLPLEQRKKVLKCSHFVSSLYYCSAECQSESSAGICGPLRGKYPCDGDG